MTFGAAVAKCFRDTLNFEARAPRSEYWWFFLFGLAGSFATSSADGMAFGWEDDSASFFEAAFWLATLMTVLAVSIRRLHDLDRTGWWVLLGVPLFLLGVITGNWDEPSPPHWDHGDEMFFFVVFVASVISFIVLLIFLVQKGTDGENRFGPNPLAGGGGKPPMTK